MFSLVIALATLSQAPGYVEGYKPKAGDKVVLARDEIGRKVPITKSELAASMFSEYIIGESPVESHYEAVVNGDELSEVAAGTPIQILETKSLVKTPIFKVRILEGPLKGKTTYTYSSFCRKPDPAQAKATAAARKKRGPLDKTIVIQDLKEVIAKTTANEAEADLTQKKKLIRDAVEPICRKHAADYGELNELATHAGVVVVLNGERYDIAGNLIRKYK
jgi:hypothetical protein